MLSLHVDTTFRTDQRLLPGGASTNLHGLVYFTPGRVVCCTSLLQ